MSSLKPPVFSIRPAQASDYARVASIRVLTIGGEYFQQTFIDEIENQNYIYLVLESQSVLLGYAILELTPPEASIIEMAIDPEQQNQGWGKTLLQDLITLAAVKNCCDLFLEVREHNWLAQKLYLGAGFKELSRRKDYYKNPTEDAIVLSFSLG